MEKIQQKGDPEKPLGFLNRRPIGWMEEDDHFETTNLLRAINLGGDSTVEDIRRVAITLRAKLVHGSLSRDETKALRIALHESNDCINDEEFLAFLLEDVSFEQIESARD